MERPFKCKTLKAEFEEIGFALRGPCTAEFEIDAAPAIQVKITQARSRTITIESPTDIEVNRLYGILYRVETLLMIFDGKFIQLHMIELLNSEETSPEQLISCAKNYANKRLSYFYSADFCRYEINRLIDFEDIITKELYLKWSDLLDVLDIAFQIYLYMIGGKELTIDVRCAFLIELAEAFVEIVKRYKGLFPELQPGDKKTTLRECLKSLIDEYGSTVFKKESSGKYDKFLQLLVNNRVRIMHIKRNLNQKILDKEELILYVIKTYILYRIIIFNILDIDKSKYQERLTKCIAFWNRRNDNLMKFM